MGRKVPLTAQSVPAVLRPLRIRIVGIYVRISMPRRAQAALIINKPSARICEFKLWITHERNPYGYKVRKGSGIPKETEKVIRGLLSRSYYLCSNKISGQIWQEHDWETRDVSKTEGKRYRWIFHDGKYTFHGRGGRAEPDTVLCHSSVGILQ